MLGALYNEIFYRPLLNGLVVLTNVLPYHDLGLAVILLTLLVRTILFPFTHHSIKSQVKMRELEPAIARIKQDHKDSQEEQARRTMALYKEHGVNPFSGCLILIIQLPVLIALYQVFQHGVGPDIAGKLYEGIVAPTNLNTLFLGFIELTERSIFIAALAAITQFFQIKLSIPPTQPTTPGSDTKADFARALNSQMVYTLPIVIFFVGLRFPAAVSLYWTTMNVLAIIHEMIVRRKAQRLKETTA